MPKKKYEKEDAKSGGEWFMQVVKEIDDCELLGLAACIFAELHRRGRCSSEDLVKVGLMITGRPRKKRKICKQ